jgi:hypothetical protein
MSSLADFSYSREDDEDSHGRLSPLRALIQGESRGQLGCSLQSSSLIWCLAASFASS